MARKARVSAAILALMKTSERHSWTLEALQGNLAEGGISADFSSIFRAVEKLVSEGALRKMLLLDAGHARFELPAPHHDHLHCTTCDALFPVPCVIKGAACAALEDEIGVVISEHQIIFSGLCPSCRTNQAVRRF
jgi:Fe2+ or Zn2+ uptake regulation protein